MIRYKSTIELSIEEFKTPFQVKPDKENRWVEPGSSLPWDSLASIYYSYLLVFPYIWNSINRNGVPRQKA